MNLAELPEWVCSIRIVGADTRRATLGVGSPARPGLRFHCGFESETGLSLMKPMWVRFNSLERREIDPFVPFGGSPMNYLQR